MEHFSSQSPLGSKGQLKHFGPEPANRFIRDTLLVEDIEGAKFNDKHKHRTVRDNISCKDIQGAVVKDYYRISYDKETAMGA